jgi:hypothetical protein
MITGTILLRQHAISTARDIKTVPEKRFFMDFFPFTGTLVTGLQKLSQIHRTGERQGSADLRR